MAANLISASPTHIPPDLFTSFRSELDTMPAFIPDGYNQAAFLKEIPGQYESVWIHYRPSLCAENGAFRRSTDDEDGDERSELLKHLLDWDVCGPDGKCVDITDDVLRRIHPHLRGRMLNIIQGMLSPDRPEGDCPWPNVTVAMKPARRVVEDQQGNSSAA